MYRQTCPKVRPMSQALVTPGSHIVGIKYWDAPRSTVSKSNDTRLKQIVRGQGWRGATAQNVVLGVSGTIYKRHTDKPLSLVQTTVKSGRIILE